ncbi:MAG: hypothetical protein DMG55_30960 [Acidobacteria bacterium]|nr:MAG: hypothetical protein DMG55_30960 [Acidobacteriota bacterium]
MFHTAEFEQGLAARFFRRHPGRGVLRNLALQMKVQFPVGFPFNRVFVKQVAEPLRDALQPAHGQPPYFTRCSGPIRSPPRVAPSLLARSAGTFFRTS